MPNHNTKINTSYIYIYKHSTPSQSSRGSLNLIFQTEMHRQTGNEDLLGQGTRGSLQGEPCITPGQKMGALPGSSARGFGYRDTAGLKYIPAAAAAAVVARPFILGNPESSCPAVVMGLPRMSLIPCGVPPASWELRLDSWGALKPPGPCCSAYGNRDVFISVMLCNAASGVLPRTKALCRLASICPTANICEHEPPKRVWILKKQNKQNPRKVQIKN